MHPAWAFWLKAVGMLFAMTIAAVATRCAIDTHLELCRRG
jgi:hypothetical protein